jgi:Raf kinase inhibitor-like YbhB/YbcL family protein
MRTTVITLLAGFLLSVMTQTLAAKLAIRSPAFAENRAIPAANTCDGSAGNPALIFTGIPPGTRSLAVIVEDPDVPWFLQWDNIYVHWLRWNLAPETEGIPEGKAQGGINEGGGPGYVDPCPPNGEHRYVFKLFALDATIEPSVKISTVTDLYRAMEGHTLAHAETIGRYRRPFTNVAVPLTMFGVLSLVVAGSLYGIYRGIRVMARRRNVT